MKHQIYYTVVIVQIAIVVGSLQSQVVDTIRANPKFHTLRSIWKVTGENTGDMVGAGLGSVSDVNNDGLEDFAYYTASNGFWYVHYGAEGVPALEPTWVFEKGAGRVAHPIPGHFLGEDSLHVGFFSFRWVDSGKSTDFYYQLRIFSVVDDSLRRVPSYIWDPGATEDTAWFITPNAFLSANLDNADGDELVMVSGVHIRNRIRSQVGEVWFYRGGKDFQVDVPDHVIVDQGRNTKENDYTVYVDDFDGDTLVDLALTARYEDGSKLKLWYGREGSPWNWSNTPDREIPIDGKGLNRSLALVHLDGDGCIDIATTVGTAPTPGVYIYLSSSQKDFRTRTFDYSDADIVLETEDYHIPVARTGGGYINDTTDQFESLLLIGPSIYDPFEPMLLLFSGGKGGPNVTWDGLYAPSRDGVTAGPVMQHIKPIADCNGDGWDDLLISDDDWYLFDRGIAMVISGGPEIPNDDPTVSVQEIATEEHAAALHAWPNPMHSELHIAWRGDLRTKPRQFMVHTLLGELVATGKVEPGVGIVTWKNTSLPSGTYVLSVLNKEGSIIARTKVVKTE